VVRHQWENRIARALVLLYVGGISTLCFGQQTAAEQWIEAGHWKRARAAVEQRMHDAPNDPLANFLLSQVRGAFGDRTTPLALAEKAVALDGHTAKYQRQVAEVLGVLAQHSTVLHQPFLARRFRKEIECALVLDPRDVQANRDLLEFYLLAPGIVGGSRREAQSVAQRIAGLDPAEGLLAKARIAVARSDFVAEEILLRRAAEIQPPSYRARLALAEFYAAPEHSNPGAAEVSARELIKLDPGRSDGYAVLADVYASRGSWDELERVLAEAAHAVPDDLFPYYRAGERLIARGVDFNRAERYFRTYREQEAEGNRPTLGDADRNLARIAASHLSRSHGEGAAR
jgi:tetratricopeptide (TPR) repeat protein